MSSRDGRPPSRRLVLTGLIGLTASAAAAAELPTLGGGGAPFVRFDPLPTMPILALTDLNGRPASLGPNPKGALLLNLWATWCPACREELPALAAAADALERAGVAVAVVSVDAGPRETARAYLDQVGAGRLRAYHDPDGATLAAPQADGRASPFQRWRMPLSFLIDRRGGVRGYAPGAVDWLAPDSLALIRGLGAER